MASIQTLSSEVLSAIFQFTLDQSPSRLHAIQLLAQHRARIHALTGLSLVCKRWRSTVLGDGTLWIAVPIDTSRTDCQQSTTAVLERSKQAMLEVSMVCDDTLDLSHEALFSEISKNINRIKALHFFTTSPGMLRNFSAPAPNLQTLEIFISQRPTDLGFLFGGNIPALRSLVLAGLPSWPPGLFANLKDLCLILPPPHPTTNVSLLIDVMSGSPGIEQIKMSGFLSMVDDSPPSSLARLPNVRKFTMRDCDSAIVLSHTVIPATADIKVVMRHCKMRAAMDIDFRDCHILRSVPEEISAMGFLTESTVFVLQQGRGVGFGIGFYRSRSSQPSLRIIDSSTSARLFARLSIEALARHPHHFRNIKDLSIALYPGDVVQWSILRSFERIERLSMIALHLPSLLSALMIIGDDSRPICPVLKKLHVREGDDGHAVTLDRDDVIKFFAARRALGCVVMEIIICGSGGRKWTCAGPGDRITESCV